MISTRRLLKLSAARVADLLGRVESGTEARTSLSNVLNEVDEEADEVAEEEEEGR